MNGSKKVATALYILSYLSGAFTFTCIDSEEVENNPLGECAGCEGQIFINDDCTQSFYCSQELASDGCLLSCESGQRVHVDYSSDTWECVEREETFVCPGSFSVDCDEVFQPDCHCANELWMRPDCQGGFLCSEAQTEQGQNIGRTLWCFPGEVIEIDFTDVLNYKCTNNTDTCPGSFHFGCDGGDFGEVTTASPPTCQSGYELAENPLGTCDGCDGQIFISEDCSESFYCHPNMAAAGCFLNCGDNQRVHLDVATDMWECVEREPNFVCPGRFSVDCTDELDVECHCQNEIWMRPGCRGAYVCNQEQTETGQNFGRAVWCTPPKVLQIDFTNLTNYKCVDDANTCPGSFHFGCEGGDFGDKTTIEPPILTCQTGVELADNPIGTCDGCEGQIFINEDCTESFYCFPEMAGDGCYLLCDSSERVYLDVSTNIWECIPREDTFTCPGKFSVDCVDELDINCHCKNELWMRPDCQGAYLCSDEQSETGQNFGRTIWCTLDKVLQIDFTDILNYECTTDTSSCPGSFHFGCEGGDFGDITTINPPVCQNSVELFENPIGTCTCEGQIWVEPGCKKAFYCLDLEGHGCYDVRIISMPF